MTQGANEFLLWRCGSHDFGLELPHCREIVMNVGITRLPRAPQFILGLANLRGGVISVIDLEVLLGYKTESAIRKEANLIRLRTEGYPIAVAADNINDTVFLEASELEPAPANLSESESIFIRRVAKRENGLILIPDLKAIITKIH